MCNNENAKHLSATVFSPNNGVDYDVDFDNGKVRKALRNQTHAKKIQNKSDCLLRKDRHNIPLFLFSVVFSCVNHKIFKCNRSDKS